MLSVAQIVKVTQKITKKRANLVKLLKVKKAVQFDDKTYFMVECRTSKDKHLVEMVLHTAKKLTTRNLGKTKVWLTCTCGHHVFRCEHALWLKGSSSLIHTAGIEPGESGLRVNPLDIPWCCKHAIRVFQQIPKIRTKSGKLPLKLAIKMEMDEIDVKIPKKKKKKSVVKKVVRRVVKKKKPKRVKVKFRRKK